MWSQGCPSIGSAQPLPMEADVVSRKKHNFPECSVGHGGRGEANSQRPDPLDQSESFRCQFIQT